MAKFDKATRDITELLDGVSGAVGRQAKGTFENLVACFDSKPQRCEPCKKGYIRSRRRRK